VNFDVDLHVCIMCIALPNGGTVMRQRNPPPVVLATPDNNPPTPNDDLLLSSHQMPVPAVCGRATQGVLSKVYLGRCVSRAPIFWWSEAAKAWVLATTSF
jgi:hypothetical protein